MNDTKTDEWFEWAWDQSPPVGGVELLQRMGIVREPWDRRWVNMGVSPDPSWAITIACSCTMRPEQIWPKGKKTPALKQHPRVLAHNTFNLQNSVGYGKRLSIATCDNCRVVYWVECPNG